MKPIKAKIIHVGRNQAISVPAELAFDTDTVTLEKHGDLVIVRPFFEKGWETFFGDESSVLPQNFDTGDDPTTSEA